MSIPVNILAGQLIDLQFDPEAKAFKHAVLGLSGPVFTVRTLDFFEASEVLEQKDPKDKIRRGLALMLTAVDGDKDKAAAFIAAPHPRYTSALYLAAWGETWGN